MDSCAETSVSTDFCIFGRNLIPSRSALPCSVLRISSETESNGQIHPFAPLLEYKKRSRRCSLRLRVAPFSRLRHHSVPYCCLNQGRRFAFEASGSRTKPDLVTTPRRVPPPEHPSAPRWFASTRSAAIPPLPVRRFPFAFRFSPLSTGRPP